MADAGEGAGEFHGLPREACSTDEPAELEIRHTEQDADWDFRPWPSEKLNRMQTAAKDLVGVWITDPRFANERRCRGKLILARIFHIRGGTCHTLYGRAALPRRPELGRSSSFALPDYEICGLEQLRCGLLRSFLAANSA